MEFKLDKLKVVWNKRFKRLTEKESRLVSLLLGYYPKNWELFDLSLRLKSLSESHQKSDGRNNERLEYLGDAVLETIVSDYLYKKFPTRNEGYLTEARATIVKRATLNQIGKKMGLESFIAGGNGVQSNNSYGNVVEALIGALFIDGGYDAAHTFVVHLLEDFIKIDRLLIKEENYKSTLIEICQKQRWSYRFELIEQQRLEQNRMRFQTRVYVDDIDCGSGVGNSKRVSEQNAAKHALPILRKKSLKPAR